MDNDCEFTFIAANLLPQITGPAVAVFDDATSEYTIEIPVSGVTDTVDVIDFLLQDVE